MAKRAVTWGSAAVVVAALCGSLLTGCTEATSDSTVATSPGESSSETASPSGSAGGSTGGTPSSSSPGKYQQLRVIDDPCRDRCVEGGTVEVKHPKYGPMTVIPYWDKREQGDGPPRGKASYALYQNGQTIGYVEDEQQDLMWFGVRPAESAAPETWNLENGSNVDKYGNVYLSYDGGVTVLTPTDQGYNSYGSMPSGVNPFEGADLQISPEGEPTITVTDQGEKTVMHWDGNQFVPVVA
ncbi:hypothetical protein [Kocuria massiliensis]|uniref:hypothetical protein n=1 Tax=Kocuria massiliensis TaxID=1926282 RepID=UPI0022B967E1|nr:hypothetical protein [Kocuria massiliensis]